MVKEKGELDSRDRNLVTMTINDRLTNLSSSISLSNGSTRLSLHGPQFESGI